MYVETRGIQRCFGWPRQRPTGGLRRRRCAARPPGRERGENMGGTTISFLPAAAVAHQRQAGDNGGAPPDRQARCGSRGRRAHVRVRAAKGPKRKGPKGPTRRGQVCEGTKVYEGTEVWAKGPKTCEGTQTCEGTKLASRPKSSTSEVERRDRSDCSGERGMATAATRMLTGDGGTHVGDGFARRAQGTTRSARSTARRSSVVRWHRAGLDCLSSPC